MSETMSVQPKARGFVVDKESGGPAVGVPVLAVATLDEGVDVLIGLLASDSAGYVSFDFQALRGRRPKKVTLSALGHENATVDLMQQPRSPSGLEFLLRVDPRLTKQSALESRLPSVQNPDVTDWELSPYSFVTRGGTVLGEDGCETLLPSTAAEREYRYAQVVRVSVPTDSMDDRLDVFLRRAGGAGTTSAIAPLDPSEVVDRGEYPIELGEVLEYRQTWTPLGHALGSIIYSTALAPCESVNLAVIDWSRRDLATRQDQIVSQEGLYHSQRRDRTIEETIEAALEETQGGWSLLGGVGAAIPSTPVVAGVGGAITRSWGNRDLTAESMQELHDAVVQQTNVGRTLNSTVVVQATQEESNYLETRTITNHNHCHALTLQFYQVMRHYKVSTEYVRSRRVVLVPHRILFFTTELALRYRAVLEPALRDPALANCFDAMIRLRLCPNIYTLAQGEEGSTDSGTDGSTSGGSTPGGTASNPPPKAEVERYELILESNPAWNDGDTWGAIWVDLRLKNGDRKQLWFKESVNSGGQALKKIAFPVDITSSGAVGIDPTDIDLVQVKWSESNPADTWGFTRIRIRYAIKGGSGLTGTIVDEQGDPELKRFDNGVQQTWNKDVVITAPTPAPPPTPLPLPEPHQTVVIPPKVEDECCESRLLVHLNANRGYYSRAVWLLLDPTERTMMLQAALSPHPEILATLDTNPLAVSGNFVAFAYNQEPTAEEREREAQRVAQATPRRAIVSVPTRGMFAETHLSHCNACEVRDVSRFWKWDEAPCDAAPTISGITPGPRGQTPSVESTTLPSPVVQVMQTPAAPDPIGLAAALGVLGTPNVFRDMSAMSEVSRLVTGLASGAVTLAEAEQMAKRAQNAMGSTGPAGWGGSFPSAPPPAPEERFDNLQVAKEVAAASDALGWDETTSRDVTSRIVGGQPGSLILASTGGAGAAAGGADAAGKLIDVLKGVITEVTKGVVTQITKESNLTMDQLHGGTALLAGFGNPIDYLPPRESLSNYRREVAVYLDNLGDVSLSQGLRGKIIISWLDDWYLSERAAARAGKEALWPSLAEVRCKMDIRVVPVGGGLGQAVNAANVGVDLVSRPSVLSEDPPRAGVDIVLSISVQPKGGTGGATVGTVTLPLFHEMAPVYTIKNNPHPGAFEPFWMVPFPPYDSINL